MADRTKDQILDQVVYAVQCVAVHYGPAFSADGLQELRKILGEFSDWRTDSTFRVDVLDDDEFVDFHQRIIWPDGWWKRDFEETIKDSYGNTGSGDEDGQ